MGQRPSLLVLRMRWDRPSRVLTQRFLWLVLNRKISASF